MSRLSAKLGSKATSSRPPCPPVSTSGTPASGADTLPLRSTMRSRPGRSVTIIRPSGRNSSAQGCSRPRATVSARTTPSVAFGVGERGAWP
jgi:hypothetical protein